MKSIILPLIVCISLVTCMDLSAQEKIQSKIHSGVTLENLPTKIEELNKNNEEIISILTEEENADPKLKKYTLVTAIRSPQSIEYYVFKALTLYGLKEDMNKAAKTGWVPAGGIFAEDGYFYQVIYRYK